MEAFNFLLLFSLSLCRSSNFTCNGGPRSLTMSESEKVQAQGSACLFACQQAGMAYLLKLVTSGPLVLPRNQTFQKLKHCQPGRRATVNSRQLPQPPPSVNTITSPNPPQALSWRTPLTHALLSSSDYSNRNAESNPPPAITTLEEADALVPEPSKTRSHTLPRHPTWS